MSQEFQVFDGLIPFTHNAVFEQDAVAQNFGHVDLYGLQDGLLSHTDVMKAFDGCDEDGIAVTHDHLGDFAGEIQLEVGGRIAEIEGQALPCDIRSGLLHHVDLDGRYLRPTERPSIAVPPSAV